MVELSQFQLDVYAHKILDDYDAKTPLEIFKDKISISIEDALRIQLAVTNLREKRGEEVIGYKIGCVSKDTQRKMGFTHIEGLVNLDKLIGKGRFKFIGLPLRIRGGTGSPIRAVAVFNNN